MNDEELFEPTDEEYEEIRLEAINDNIESGWYRIVRNRKRYRKLNKRENVHIFWHEPINAWLWETLSEQECDYEPPVECHGSGSGRYDNTSGSSGVYYC